jgi:hypothetical protein
MPDLPEGRVSVADIVRITGYSRSYLVRLLEVDALREYLQYDASTYPPSYPGAAVDFFRWVNSDARPSHTKKGYEKATASNIMEIVAEYVPGVAYTATDRVSEQPDNRMSDPREGYDAGKERLPDLPPPARPDPMEIMRQLLSESGDRTAEKTAQALAQVITGLVIAPVEDELLTYDEVKERYLKRWGRARLKKAIPTVDTGLWRKSDVLRHIAGMGQK